MSVFSGMARIHLAPLARGFMQDLESGRHATMAAEGARLAFFPVWR
ncbi:MAG TPA: hypothetical protein VIZ17_05480 [Acetobacteraceae bacterium]